MKNPCRASLCDVWRPTRARSCRGIGNACGRPVGAPGPVPAWSLALPRLWACARERRRALPRMMLTSCAVASRCDRQVKLSAGNRQIFASPKGRRARMVPSPESVRDDLGVLDAISGARSRVAVGTAVGRTVECHAVVDMGVLGAEQELTPRPTCGRRPSSPPTWSRRGRTSAMRFAILREHAAGCRRVDKGVEPSSWGTQIRASRDGLRTLDADSDERRVARWTQLCAYRVCTWTF